MKKPALFMTFIIFIVIILSVIQVAVSNKLSTTGTNLWKIEEEIAVLEKKNAVLKEDLLLATSLSTISSTAGMLGFTDNKSQVFLTAPLPLAIRQ